MDHQKANYCILTCTMTILVATANTVFLSSHEVAPVCGRDELELACTVPGRALEWVVTFKLPQDMTIEHPFNSVDHFFPIHTVTVSNISFTFSRISPPNSRPLISGLLISPATSVVNGTVVVCEDVETRANSSTRVHVIYRKL